MKISYDVEIPRRTGRRSRYIPYILDFLRSDKTNICFTFDEYKPTKEAYKALSQLSRRYGFKAIMRGWSVICVKEEKKGEDEDGTDED